MLLRLKSSLKLALLCALLTPALIFPARAEVPNQAKQAIPASFSNFQDTVEIGIQALKQPDLTKASALLAQAEKLYAQALAELESLEPELAGQHRQALVSNLCLFYFMQAGQLREQQQRPEALALYDKIITLAPWFPMTRYLRATLFQELQQPERAAVDFYETIRLARFPALRDLPNPLKQDAGLFTDTEGLEAACVEELKTLGQPGDYPLERDFSTGKAQPQLAVPGLGVQVRKPGGESLVNVYLGADMTKTVDALGQADRVQVRAEGADFYLELGYQGFTLDFAQASASLMGIYLYADKQAVRVPGGTLSVGERIEQVSALLGREYGYRRQDLQNATMNLEAFLDFPSLGLSFGQTPAGKVGVIILYPPKPVSKDDIRQR
ncbi:MAG: hypothetical protein ACAI44_38845 [Candidatus Sericytochromatia bacterium]